MAHWARQAHNSLADRRKASEVEAVVEHRNNTQNSNLNTGRDTELGAMTCTAGESILCIRAFGEGHRGNNSLAEGLYGNPEEAVMAARGARASPGSSPVDDPKGA